MKADKPAILKYVNICKRLIVIFGVIAIPAFMICLIFAFMGYAAFWFLAPAILIVYLVAYGIYAVRVSMGTVIGIETTDKVVYVRTKRTTYTYDVRQGCKEVTATARKFVCTFETQDSRDKFTFYRKIWFTPSYETQFTAEEIAAFYPEIETMDLGK